MKHPCFPDQDPTATSTELSTRRFANPSILYCPLLFSDRYLPADLPQALYYASRDLSEPNPWLPFMELTT